MVSNDCIDKVGIVEEVKENSVLIRFQSEPACGSCRAKFICGTGSDERNLIEIYNKNRTYHQGDAVKVFSKRGPWPVDVAMIQVSPPDGCG